MKTSINHRLIVFNGCIYLLRRQARLNTSQSVVMTAVVQANTNSAANVRKCRACSNVSGLAPKIRPEVTSKRHRSQHFWKFSQFYSISDRSVDVAPRRISSLHTSVQPCIQNIKISNQAGAGSIIEDIIEMQHHMAYFPGFVAYIPRPYISVSSIFVSNSTHCVP